MIIQSLSFVVPPKGCKGKCINNCKMCVSGMHPSPYPNMMQEKGQFFDLYLEDLVKRVRFARDNGCNTVMLTGNCEPQQNREYLQTFGIINKYMLPNPFKWIEMQTTGVLLDRQYLRFLRNHVGVTTISLSINAFDSEYNAEVIGMNPGLFFRIEDLCALIKEYDFNLRLSVNLNDYFDDIRHTPAAFFDKCRNFYKADQVTLRVLYSDSSDTPQSKWVREHATNPETVYALTQYVLAHGRELEKLEFGRTKYSVQGMSTVIDDDCMNTAAQAELKYVILQPNCKLYSKWDDPASLIF